MVRWGYEKSTKTAYEVRAHCSLENYAHKYQLISVRTEHTPMKWSIDSQKYDFYINEEGMYELLFKSQQLQAKAFRKYCCTLADGSLGLKTKSQTPDSLTYTAFPS